MQNNFDKGNKALDKTAVVKAVRNFIILLLVFALVATTAYYLGRTFFENWPIIGSSMEPNIHNGDRVIIVKKKSYNYNDIIIFKTSSDNTDTFSGKYLIKRVIGKEGDVIETKFSSEERVWHVYRNGEVVSEENILEGITVYSEFKETVPEGYYFVLGDNRNNSHDSHIPGFYADGNEIVGKAFVRYKSLKDFMFL